MTSRPLDIRAPTRIPRIDATTYSAPRDNGSHQTHAASDGVHVPQVVADRILTRDQLRNLPRPTPLIEDTLDRGTVVELVGYWGTLKSFLCVEWACKVATGRPWLGRYTEPVRVLYVAAEGAAGLAERIAAWETHWVRLVPDLALSVYPRPVHLGDRRQVRELCDAVAEGGYGFVIIDTVAKSMPGMDENAAADMGTVVAALYRVLAATPNGTGVVLGVHHTGKDRVTSRGSSALESGVDTVYLAEGDAGRVQLTRTKRKDGPVDDIHVLQFVPVDGTESGVISVRGAADIPEKSTALLSVFMSAFEATGATKVELRAVADMPSATFHRSLSRLVSEGLLVNSGTDGRPFYRFKGTG